MLASAPRMPASAPTILVADDSRATARALSELLTGAGLEVELAVDGPEALRRALEPHIALVLLDVAMPELDGLQVLRLLRARPDRRALPVLVLTVSQDPGTRLGALQLGADDVLTKPWDPAVLLARVRRCVELKALLDASREPPAPSATVTARVPSEGLFRARLDEEFRRAQRYADPLALVLLAPDAFESEGRAALLEPLRRALRDTDLVGQRERGGFAVLLPKTSLAGGLTAAERMLQQLRGAKRARASSSWVSLGVAAYPHRSHADAEALWASADEALLLAQREGGDRIRLFAQALATREGEKPPRPQGRF